MQTLAFRAMNTDIFLAAENSPRAPDGLEAAKSFIEESERRFSRFLPESEVSALNSVSGTWHSVSSDLMEMLQQAQVFSAETYGLFDPSILPDLKRAGYDRSMDEIRRDGGASSRATATSLPSVRPKFTQVEFDDRHYRVRLPAGMEIDLGGFAKGWIVEKAAQALRAYTTACAVSAGGDIVFEGMPADGSQWHVYIEDPSDADKKVAELHMGAGAVVTSSVAKRRWLQGAVERHHLIDPRTGEPAQTTWLSVTVAAPWIATAEVYAKALLIGGESEAPLLLATHPEISYYTVDRDGRVAENPVKVEYS
jgi:thiamine biosynthesis lipoprotein